MPLKWESYFSKFNACNNKLHKTTKIIVDLYLQTSESVKLYILQTKRELCIALAASFKCVYLLNTALINSFRFLQPTTLIFSRPSVPKAFTACFGTTHVL